MLRILDNLDKEHWDRYAAKNGSAKCAHLYSWGDCLAATYSLPVYRLAAIRPGTQNVCGILPLMLFSPPGGDIRLISLPYTDAAGMLADDLESDRYLLHAALDLADSLGATHLELRQDWALRTLHEGYSVAGSWRYTAHRFKTGLIRPVSRSVDELWSTLAAKVRNQIRKARRCGCVARTGSIELLPDFYAVFSENMRDLGSPVHDKNLFRRLLRSESLKAACIVVYLDEQPAAAAVVLLHRATLYNPWASSIRKHRPFCPNMLLYWSMLQHAVDTGCRWFDFGRSTPNALTCRFKMQWGAKMDPLCWHVFSRTPHDWLPSSESLELEHWKTMDLMRSRREGPAIRRWISL